MINLGEITFSQTTSPKLMDVSYSDSASCIRSGLGTSELIRSWSSSSAEPFKTTVSGSSLSCHKVSSSSYSSSSIFLNLGNAHVFYSDF